MAKEVASPGLQRLFGLDREKKIADSGVRNIFTPHQPISEVDLLFGRQPEVQKLVETLNTPGQHVLLYGERGVGKSSLANVVRILLSLMVESEIFVKRCDNADTFESIMVGPLAAIGADLAMPHIAPNSEGQITGNINVRDTDNAVSIVAGYEARHALSPSSVAESLQGLDALLIIDEADAIGSAADRRKIAELIKLSSDSGSRFKVMVVGIAETGAELTAAHPSVQRCIREAKLERMSDSELREIVVTGAEKSGLAFAAKVTKSIVQLSAGYPHFTHLIALKCAEHAVAEGRLNIEESHLRAALVDAVKDAEGSLKREFDDAIRSSGSKTYADIVVAAASLGADEFTAAELREAISGRTGDRISQGALNNYLKRLVSEDGSTVLRRKAKGVYCFSDPRMASFARMHALAARHSGI